MITFDPNMNLMPATTDPWSVAGAQRLSLRPPGACPSKLAALTREQHQQPIPAGLTPTGLGLFTPLPKMRDPLPVDALGALGLPTGAAGLAVLGVGGYLAWRYFFRNNTKAKRAELRRARARAAAREAKIKADYA